MGDDGWEESPVVAVVQQHTRTFTSSRNRVGRGRARNYEGDDRPRNNWRDDSDQSRSQNFSWRNNDPGSDAQTNNSSWGPTVQSASEGGFRKPRKYRESANSLEISVPSNQVGRIIGRGGSKIKEIERESNAEIKVMKEGDGLTKIVRLIGSDEEIDHAKQIIENLIEGDDRPRYSDSNKTTEPAFSAVNEDGLIDWEKVNRECELALKEKYAHLAPLIKDFYREAESVAQMTQEEVEDFRLNNNNIQTFRLTKEGEPAKKVPNPVRTFEECFEDYPEIMQEIRKNGFVKPSPIQSQAWPVLLSGDDLIGIAQTGTGKTLAFLLPAFIHIEGQPIPRSERKGPNVLVLAPTRELAQQIEREVQKYSYKNIKSVCLYGGGDRRKQINSVSSGVEIVIATPGRLNDLVMAGHLDLTHITYLVLDEADRMLDMGFEPQIRKSLYDIRPDRQTIMTSATWPLGVKRLAETYTNNPVQVFVGSLDLVAVHSVKQTILILEDNEDVKYQTLMDWVCGMTEKEKVIVFCGKKARASHIMSELALKGIECQGIHGDRDQQDREQAIEDMKTGAARILIATDVASRGIDIEDVTHVINYDFPKNIEEYVHRVGRTGRAGRTGEAISYVTRADWGQAKELIQILQEADQEVPEELVKMQERFEAMKEKREREGGGDFNRRRGGGRGPRW